jgi:hypothetical protein
MKQQNSQSCGRMITSRIFNLLKKTLHEGVTPMKTNQAHLSNGKMHHLHDD